MCGSDEEGKIVAIERARGATEVSSEQVSGERRIKEEKMREKQFTMK
jgi:uncharacterized protein YuzE